MKTVYIPVTIQGLAVVYVEDESTDINEIQDSVEYSAPMICGNKMIDVTIKIEGEPKIKWWSGN